MDEEDKKFEVRDKRIFNQEGEQVREPSKEAPAPDFSPAGEVAGKDTEQGGPHSHPEGELPPVDFISFVGLSWGLGPYVPGRESSPGPSPRD